MNTQTHQTLPIDPNAPLAVRSGDWLGVPCVTCGKPAVAENYDGQYCKDCLQLHILEKMFVNLTALQNPSRRERPRNDQSATVGREVSEVTSDATAATPNEKS